MKIEGEHQVGAPRERVWALLNDPAVLQRAVPGIKELEAVGPDVYRGVIELAVGPVRGAFEGKIQITDKVPPERVSIIVEGRGRPGTVKARGDLQLLEQDGGTLVRYAGDAQVTGLLMSVGHRLFGGVAREMAGKFFGGLVREIEQSGRA